MQLATTGGDTTVKLWDFAHGTCIQTFADHQRAGAPVFLFISVGPVSDNRFTGFTSEMFTGQVYNRSLLPFL